MKLKSNKVQIQRLFKFENKVNEQDRFFIDTAEPTITTITTVTGIELRRGADKKRLETTNRLK